MKQSIRAATGLIMLGGSFAAHAGFTDLDTTFGSGGSVTLIDPETTFAADVFDASEGADSNLYVFVGADEVARLTPSGALDSTFGTAGFLVLSGASSAYSQFYAVAVDSVNQKIYVAAQDATTRAVTIAAYDFSGNPLSSFGTSGSVAFPGLGNAFPSGLQVLSSGTLLLNGDVDEQGNSPPAAFAVEVTPAGVPSTTFGNSGVALLSVPTTTTGLLGQEIFTWKAAVDTAGRVYVAGGSEGNIGLLVRFTSAGQPDTTFGNGGLVTQALTTDPNAGAEFELVSVQADGSIAAFGSYDQASNSNNDLSETAVLDTFNASGAFISTQSITDNLVPFFPNYSQQTDGKFVLVNGQQGAPGSTTPNPNVIRLLGLTSAGSTSGGTTTGGTSGGTTTGGTTTGGTTSGGTTAGTSGGGTSGSSSGGGGSATPLMLVLGFAAYIRRRFVKA